MNQGSVEGELMKKIMSEGGLIPYQLTVKVLVNAIQKQVSKVIFHPFNILKAYLIDGFPRALDQAKYFEEIICEPQSVLYFNASEQVCTERCLQRAKTSGRVDDTEEIIKKRLQTYNDQSRPVVEFYKAKGTVIEIDGGLE